ncbi:dTDP-4-amino-4,6-dideoxy-D-galactose acyltransferase [Xenorhabdus szentirmaii]|uniref:dTDP-fucosamine acetyltransferase n=2 Tax=Xenorhabdus szentirmaii TaxID=290112 RepID=W1J854_9GAMM|nr:MULTISPECIES: dTDP-4-amino-4,6-dideoxy-D-galactose acyltransferase [Xenorhabdus]MBD2780759.1 dTDP-4-amino-4,6-dideoxy-D-galactose acyltransferase [Xenorhabdus sp. 38]MBD2791873.1 dTDP-4-amino-4,6-dideoxy-D-galactose acyltransferase [Xenorhabdus sp. CUL]MBD2800628.1 dTDP-4-amino-4,6-dideoxy-D-galactose acyltransferase [Xenorhabdus sp. M]MBD2803783.1 dTDP-4-amino-4,6-dideoxy-D-galactose acyltransferase [Xenorhabdus sp. ZM]MBD2819675.1 dTDP-4-amino-4,6-dideoxy-D-galactose acyltransferase [Xeno
MSIHANLEPLVWDSQFFGISTARLHVLPETLLPETEALTTARLDEFALVQAKIPTRQTAIIDSLFSLGFSLAEGEADLLLPLDAALSGSNVAHHAEPALIAAKSRDIPALKAAAAKAFTASRFRAPWYQPDDSGRFYAAWVEKAVLGTFDHECLLINDELGQMVGFVTLRDMGSDEARIGLLAALPGTHHKGIGNKLMSAAQQWCRYHQIQRLRIATQISNLAALRLYTRHGAIIESTSYWLYRG